MQKLWYTSSRLGDGEGRAALDHSSDLTRVKSWLNCGCSTPVFSPKLQFLKISLCDTESYCFCIKPDVSGDASSLQTTCLKPLPDNWHSFYV